jgi:molybdopterin-guanine dinucleotide biosynthesis adapter protein
MRIVHIVGRQNNGKTTLICELLEELTRRGLKVGTVKHSSHDHELDRPGKDSYLHRQAGARPAAVVAAHQLALYLPRTEEDDPLTVLEPMFATCDLVLVEGFIEHEGLKLEVWRREIGKPLLARERRGIVAVVSDDAPEVSQPVWPRSDLPRLADEILKLVGLA